MKPNNEHLSELKAIRRVLWLILAGVLLHISLDTTALGKGDSAKSVGTLAGYAAMIIAGWTVCSMVVALASRPDKGVRDFDQ